MPEPPSPLSSPDFPAMSARLEALFYRYKGADRDTLRGISLELNPGEMLGLIGADGAGKTTLLRTMAGLLRPTGGYLSILGKDPLKQHTELSPKVGYMSQRFSLYEDLTVAENMQLTAGLRGISPQPEETQQLLQAAGLVPFTRRRAGQLSGGMKQKLALICAMQGDAELLLLDEPGVGVDPVSRRELRALIEQSRTAGHTIVWATAYLDEAAYCDRVCILHEGQVLYLGQPDALLQQVRGRVFAVPCPTTKRLPTLRSLKANAAVMDAMLEGNRVRVLLKERHESTAELPHHAEQVEPNFEEAFINLIGGMRTTPSKSSETTSAALQPIVQAPDEVLITRDLTKKFGDFVATNKLNLRVRRGEIFGILGANGAGKTTAFRMICGLLPASSGSAELMGLDLLRERRKAREQLGYMAQKFSLYARLTVRQNLFFFAAVYGLKGNTKSKRISQAIERFELAPYLHAPSGGLPVGLRQRLSLACATLHRPSFLFLDEPTSGVDPFARRYFWELINEWSAQGITIIVTTHFMDEAQYLHRMVIMNKGEVIAQGTPEELKQAAATDSTPHPTMEDAFIHFIQLHS